MWSKAIASALRRNGRLPVGFLLLAACHQSPAAPDFPSADRPVAPVSSARWATEEARDELSEANTVMDRAGIRPGMTVADIGAGEGYYTIRLARRVGSDGRVLAQDIVPAVRDALAERVNREQLDNVSVKLGEEADPMLPEASFDRVFMVHMYHEIAEPYEFLWRLRPSLKPDGRVVVVDARRSTAEHGTPPALLRCEMFAVGYREVYAVDLRGGSFMAMFEPAGPQIRPEAISPCRQFQALD